MKKFYFYVDFSFYWYGIIHFSRFSKTEVWLSIDMLWSILWISSGLIVIQGTVTYIVTMDYALHSLLESAAMESIVGLIVANLYIEGFEGEALRSAS